MNFSGILIGVLTFFLIGLFHPIVIYAEYYFGSRCWPVFLLVGILCMILSVRMQEILWSVSLGVLGVSCFWSIKELKEQEKRVAKGWFPKRKVASPQVLQHGFASNNPQRSLLQYSPVISILPSCLPLSFCI